MFTVTRFRVLLVVCALLAMCLSSYADDCPQYAQNCGLLNHQGQFSTYSYNGQNTAFTGINNAGDIVGIADIGNVQDGLYIHNGTTTLLSYPGASLTAPYDINNNGQIVGFWGVSAYDPHHGMLYSQGTYTSFDYPGATETYGAGINDAGQIAGTYIDNDGKYHGYLKDGNTYTSIDYPGLGSPYTLAWGINNKEEIVGYYHNGQADYGFLDVNGVFTMVSFPGANSTSAWDINDSGEIVGEYLDSGGHSHGFVYYEGHYTAVNYPYDVQIFGVNNAGDWVGQYYPSLVPEPSSIVLLMTAILGSFGAKRFFV